MATTEFYKCYGASERIDELVCLSKTNWLLIYGYGTDGEQGYTWRKYYDHKPTSAEMKADIDAVINSQTDEKILNGFAWNGKPVWLSAENQMNFKAAYDLAVQTQGDSLPQKFKLGEDAEGAAVYHTFTALTAFEDFYTKMVAHVLKCLREGWEEKDSVDYTAFNV